MSEEIPTKEKYAVHAASRQQPIGILAGVNITFAGVHPAKTASYETVYRNE